MYILECETLLLKPDWPDLLESGIGCSVSTERERDGKETVSERKEEKKKKREV